MIFLLLLIPFILSMLYSQPLFLEGLDMVSTTPTLTKMGFGGNCFDYAIHIFMKIHDRLNIREALMGMSGIYC